MCLAMEFEKCGQFNKEEGAWFKGRVYGYKRSKRLFMSYERISASLKNHPHAALNPNAEFSLSKKNAQGVDEKEFTFLTREFTKAIGARLVASCNKSHKLALDGEDRLMRFQSITYSQEQEENVAEFSDGRYLVPMTLLEIQGFLDKDPLPFSSIYKPEYYVFGSPVHGVPFFSGAELLKAELELQMEAGLVPQNETVMAHSHTI